MESLNIKIKKVTIENYHMFDDAAFWRINGGERTPEEKEVSKSKKFDDARRELSHQNFYRFAAEYDNKFIGWITIVYVPKIGKWNHGVLYVDELWTAPEFRRKGVAYKLMSKAEDVQKLTNAVRIRIYTDNPAAHKLYEKCGFKDLGKASFFEKE